MVSNPWKEPICTVLKLTGQGLFPTRIALLCKQAGAVIPQSQMQEYSHHPLPRIESGVVRGTETQRKCLGGRGFPCAKRRQGDRKRISPVPVTINFSLMEYFSASRCLKRSGW